jgi:hypothetical protein
MYVMAPAHESETIVFKALNDADSILRILWYKQILKKPMFVQA